jgi:hypothetical protein
MNMHADMSRAERDSYILNTCGNRAREVIAPAMYPNIVMVSREESPYSDDILMITQIRGDLNNPGIVIGN